MICFYILFFFFLQTAGFLVNFNYRKFPRFYLTQVFNSKGSKYNIEGRNFDNPIDLIRYMEEIKRNITNNSPGYPKQSNTNIQIPGLNDTIDDDFENDFYDKVNIEDQLEKELKKQFNQERKIPSGVRIFIKRPASSDPPELGNMGFGPMGKSNSNEEKTSSENFSIEDTRNNSFRDVGGYDNVKNELLQSADILINYEKYGKYNIRPPKGLVLEGPPGNGKTLLTRSFSGEINSSFISVSGSQFQEKYVGVGSSRIRELFDLAKDNKPCIIFIDEVDAIGRARSGDGESSNAERDSTLNQLLVAMDGFSTSDGIFVICATNRVDLLDPALVRPGRIDKKIYIGNPDHKTREDIINIHIKGKPYLNCINETHLVDITRGFSGAQIENLLNEAMLYALRDNRSYMQMKDIETIMSRILVGYQSTESVFSNDMIDRIAIHELGHAIVGIFALGHSNLIKVCLNNWSPTSPGYTIFETDEEDSNIYTKEKLFSRLMVLLAGRIAEQVFFGASITTGASKDIEEAYKLAETMIIKYGMGKKMVNPFTSEKSKTIIDQEIEHLIDSAYHKSLDIINNNKQHIRNGATLLINKKTIESYEVYNLINS
jgi:ATP-dependent metalloprotease FtsH